MPTDMDRAIRLLKLAHTRAKVHRSSTGADSDYEDAMQRFESAIDCAMRADDEFKSYVSREAVRRARGEKRRSRRKRARESAPDSTLPKTPPKKRKRT